MKYTVQETRQITELQERLDIISPPVCKEWRERYYSRTNGLILGRKNFSTFQTLVDETYRRRAVCVGDFHHFGGAKGLLIRLIDEKPESKKAVLGMEQFDLEHQPYIDLFLGREYNVDELLDMAMYEQRWECDRTPIRRLLLTARRRDLEIIALNDPTLGYNNLSAREVCTAEIVAEILNQDPKKTMLISYGDLHVCQPHLKREIDSRLRGRRTDDKTLSVRQNDQNIYWQLRGKLRLPAVARLREDTFSFHNAHPIRVLDSFFESLEMGLESDEL